MKTVRKNIAQRLKEYFIRLYIKNKPVNRQDWIRVSILAIAVPVFIYSAAQLGYKLFTYVYEDWRNSKIVELKPDNGKSPFDSISGEPANGEPYQVVYGTDTRLNAAGRMPEYEELWNRNSDMIGWITMPGFSTKPINYPIMYSGDNDFYVYRDFDKVDSYSGSIFLDGSNTPYYENPLNLDYNYVIYGHAMRNRSMFGNITDYFRNETSWQNNKIFVDFMNTRLEYQVFSTFLIDPMYNYRQTSFATDEAYDVYLKDMVAKSSHDFGIKVGPKDRIVTLSTCFQTTRRTAVIAKLVRQIIYTKGDSNSGGIVTPVVLPTYIPLNEPSPTPRVSSESMTGVSSATGSGSSSQTSTQSSSITSSDVSSDSGSQSVSDSSVDESSSSISESIPDVSSETSSEAPP